VILVNPAGTSITCHLCAARCTRPRQDTVICPVHGPMDADVNGARNIYARAGLGSGQAARTA
jgi:transposase